MVAKVLPGEGRRRIAAAAVALAVENPGAAWWECLEAAVSAELLEYGDPEAPAPQGLLEARAGVLEQRRLEAMAAGGRGSSGAVALEAEEAAPYFVRASSLAGVILAHGRPSPAGRVVSVELLERLMAQARALWPLELEELERSANERRRAAGRPAVPGDVVARVKAWLVSEKRDPLEVGELLADCVVEILELRDRVSE